MKRRVLSLVTVFTLLVILALVAVLIRIPTSIDYSGQIIEYSTVDSEISIKHDIAIEGIYYDNALGRDSFQGTFYISDIEGIGKNLNNVHFDFNPRYRYCPVFYNDYGEPIGSGIAQIFFNKNFCNGVQREHNKKLNNGLPILHKVPPKRDYGRYFCIMAEKGGTSHGGLTEKLSPFFHAKKQEVNAYGR